MIFVLSLVVAIVAIKSAAVVAIACHASPQETNETTEKNKKKMRVVQHVAADGVVAGHCFMPVAEAGLTRRMSSYASTPNHAGSPDNPNEVFVDCPLTIVNNLCPLSIAGFSEAKEQKEGTTRDEQQGISTSRASSSVISGAPKCGETDVTSSTCTQLCPVVDLVMDIVESVAGHSGGTNLAVTNDVLPAVPEIDIVPAVSTASQPVVRHDIDDDTLPHVEPTIQHEQEGRSLLSDSATSPIIQPPASINAPAPPSQAQSDHTRAPDDSDDPRLGRFNGAGLTNREYKRRVNALLSKKCPLPPTELMINNRRLIRALPISIAARVKKGKPALGTQKEDKGENTESQP